MVDGFEKYSPGGHRLAGFGGNLKGRKFDPDRDPWWQDPDVDHVLPTDEEYTKGFETPQFHVPGGILKERPQPGHFSPNPTDALHDVNQPYYSPSGAVLPADAPVSVDIEGTGAQGPIGLIDILGAEAEITIETVKRMAYNSPYGSHPITDLVKFGQDNFEFLMPNDEMNDLKNSLAPWNPNATDALGRDLGWEDTIRLLRQHNEDRPWYEQGATGILVPSTVVGSIPVKWGTRAAKAASTFVRTKATDNPNIVRQIVEWVPPELKDDATKIQAWKENRSAFMDAVLNPEVKINGLPDGALFEGDLRLWLKLPEGAIMDVNRGTDVIHATFEEAEVVQVFKRLQNLGFVDEVKTGMYKKVIHGGSDKAVEILRGWSANTGKPSLMTSGEILGNKYVAALPGFERQVEQIKTIDNRFIAAIVSKLGINPSVAATTPVKQAIIAYARGTTSIENLVEVALQGGLDVHRSRTGIGGIGRFFGMSPVKINADGTVKGTGVLWQDVFSNPAAYSDKLSDKAMAYIMDYIQIIDEAEALRVAKGLDPLGKNKEGWFYIPRQITDDKGMKMLQRSDYHVVRTYETAMEGFEQGVRYQVDPRLTLKTHLKAVYRELLNEDLARYVEKQHVSFTPTEILKKLRPAVVKKVQRALSNVETQERLVKTLQRKMTAVPIGFAGTAARKKLLNELKAASKLLRHYKGQHTIAKAEKAKAIKEIKQDPRMPASIWDDAAEGKIRAELWRNRFFRPEDVKVLENGISEIVSNPSGWAKAMGTAVDSARWLQANFDFGAPFIQGLPLLFRHPTKWAGATAMHYYAWLDPTIQARHVSNNLRTFQEMAQHGVPLGDVEFFSVMEQGRGIPVGKMIDFLPSQVGDNFMGNAIEDANSKILKVGKVGAAVRRGTQTVVMQQTFGRFQSSYNMFLATARSMLWKGMRDGEGYMGLSKADSMTEAAAYMRNLTGGLDSKSLGVKANLRSIEGAWLAFSPRLLRSTIALVSDAITFVPARLGMTQQAATLRQKESFRTIAQFLLGVHGAYVAAAVGSGVAKGWSQDRIADSLATGLNPLSGGKYLSIEVGGQWLGPGAQVRALVQLQASMVAAAYDMAKAPFDPEASIMDNDLFKVNTRDHPILRFMASRGAVATNVMAKLTEGLTGWNTDPWSNIEGWKDIPGAVGTSVLPFGVQGWMEGDNTSGMVFGGMGLRSSPERPGQTKDRLIKDVYFSMSPEELSKYGHKVGEFPERYHRDMDDRLLHYIIHDSHMSEEIGDAMQAKLEYELDMGTDYAEMTQELRQVKDHRNNTIKNVYNQHGPGKTTREAIAMHMRDYGMKSQDIRNKDKYADLINAFDEMEPIEHPRNYAKDKLFRILYRQDPPLERQDGSFNQSEWESRHDEAREDTEIADYYEDLINEIEVNKTRSEDLPKAVHIYNRDKTYIGPYWDVEKIVVDEYDFKFPDGRDKYEWYKEQGRIRQNGIDNQTPDGETGLYGDPEPIGWENDVMLLGQRDWTDDDANTLEEIRDTISERREMLLSGEIDLSDPEMNPENAWVTKLFEGKKDWGPYAIGKWTDQDAFRLEALLWKWEFGHTATNEHFEEVLYAYEDDPGLPKTFVDKIWRNYGDFVASGWDVNAVRNIDPVGLD
jgi:hypothetical protein